MERSAIRGRLSTNAYFGECGDYPGLRSPPSWLQIWAFGPWPGWSAAQSGADCQQTPIFDECGDFPGLRSAPSWLQICAFGPWPGWSAAQSGIDCPDGPLSAQLPPGRDIFLHRDAG